MNQSSFLVPHVQDYLLWALRRAVLARVEDLQLLVRLDELRVCAQREEDDAARRHEVFVALDQLAAAAEPAPLAHRAQAAARADDAPVAPAHDLLLARARRGAHSQSEPLARPRVLEEEAVDALLDRKT